MASIPKSVALFLAIIKRNTSVLQYGVMLSNVLQNWKQDICILVKKLPPDFQEHGLGGGGPGHHDVGGAGAGQGDRRLAR